MKRIIQVVLIIGVLFSITSCNLHIEKRRYRKGYHVDLSYHQHNRVQPFTNSTSTSLEETTVEPTALVQNKNSELKDSLAEVATKPVETKKRVLPSKKTTLAVKQHQKRGDHCDIITFMDGTQLEIIVEEISETEIKYKKCNFKEGPSYRTSKVNVKRIDMYNGDVYVPENIKKISNGRITGPTIASLVLGIVALICVIIGAVLSGGFTATAALAPAGLLSLIGLIIGATQLRKGAHPLAWVAFALNVFVQILAIVFTVMMFY